MKSISFEVGIIFLTIWLVVFVGYLETFGVNPICLWENLPAYCYSDQQSIVDASKNIVRVWIESGYKEKSTIGIGARLGPCKWFSKSEDIPIILLAFIGVWGSAIILILGAILYRIIIEPLIENRKLRRNERR